MTSMRFATIPNQPTIACGVVQLKKNGLILLPPNCFPHKSSLISTMQSVRLQLDVV